MTVNVFGYLILINIEFYDFSSPFSLEFQLKRYINHPRQVLTKGLFTWRWGTPGR